MRSLAWSCFVWDCGLGTEEQVQDGERPSHSPFLPAPNPQPARPGQIPQHRSLLTLVFRSSTSRPGARTGKGPSLVSIVRGRSAAALPTCKRPVLISPPRRSKRVSGHPPKGDSPAPRTGAGAAWAMVPPELSSLGVFAAETARPQAARAQPLRRQQPVGAPLPTDVRQTDA